MDRPADTRAGLSTAAQTQLWSISRQKSWRCATGKTSIRLTCCMEVKPGDGARILGAAERTSQAEQGSAAAQAAEGQPVKPTKFETDKAKLRQTIRAVLSASISFDDFAGKLLQQGVTVKESRGRLSYLTPERTKPITARKLGTILTAPPSLPFWSRTPKEQPNRPQLYPNTPAVSGSVYRAQKPPKTPRNRTAYSAWLTGRQNERREKAWAMTAGRQSTI